MVSSEGDLYQAKRDFLSDMRWIDKLPTQIVLDNFRLVHAGYDPRMALDAQGDKELLLCFLIPPITCILAAHRGRVLVMSKWLSVTKQIEIGVGRG